LSSADSLTPQWNRKVCEHTKRRRSAERVLELRNGELGYWLGQS
jgi:hypothetical protein